MSGVKDHPVTILESEKRRMLGAVQLAENFSSDLSSRLNTASDRLRGEFRNSLNDINQRQARYESGLGNLKSDVRHMEAVQNKRFKDLNGRIERGFEENRHQVSNLNKRMVAGFRDTNRRMDAGFSAVNQRIGQVQDNVNRLGQQVEKGFREAHRHIGLVQDNVNRLGKHVDEGFRSQRREYTHLIDEQGKIFQQAMVSQGRHFQQALDEQRKDLQQQIGQVAEHIQRKEMNERDAAAHMLEDVRRVVGAIDETTRHAKFKPGALDRISASLSMAETHYKNGHYQSALSDAGQRYLDAQELRLELLRLEHEWNLYLDQAKTSAAEVLAVCDTQKIAEFTVDTEDGAEKVSAEVDFWTEGRLSVLRNKVESEANRLKSESEKLTLDNLKQSIAASAQWMDETGQLVEDAREALVKSQIRQNIAQSVANSFDGTDWEVTDSTYAGEDCRFSFHTKFKNLAGDEMVTIVSPEKTVAGEIRNNLQIHYFDKAKDEKFRQALSKTIQGRMGKEGIEVGSARWTPGSERDEGDRMVLDIEGVRHQTQREN